MWQTQIQAAADRALVLTLLLMCVALGTELYFCGPHLQNDKANQDALQCSNSVICDEKRMGIFTQCTK